ncbi:hypothetical protein TDB9533_04792 [Thalassocella blandensis]|nr:hypothetical protein TDB9533_04792 [Thalassocella blandensis]
MEDVQAFLLLHSQFILTLSFFIKKGWNKPLTKFIWPFILILYLVTILAWAARAGDDFAFIHYFGMYLVAPLVCSYCMSSSDNFDVVRMIQAILILGPLYVIVGGITLYWSFMITGLNWR